MFEEYNNDPYNPTLLDEFIIIIPTGAFIALLLAHVEVVFLGKYTPSFISKWKRHVPAVVIGSVFVCFSVINAIEIQHPTWYSVIDILLVIPTAIYAHKIYLTIVKDPLKD